MSSETPTPYRRIKALTALRGIAAVCIVLFHYDVAGVAQPTRMGVSMFFMLSGFLMFRRHGHTPTRQWWSFTMPRVARLYCIHWIALAAIITIRLSSGIMVADKWLIPHIMLIQSWFPEHDAIFAHNPVAWFLGSLVVCYCAFLPLSAAIKRADKKHCVTIAAALVIMQTATLHTLGGDLAYTQPLSRIQDFTLGMVLSRLAAQTTPRKTGHTAFQVIAVSITALAIAADKALPDTLGAIDATLLWWLPAAAMICAFSATSGTGSRIMESRPLVWLGSISLEIYLFQCPIALFWNHYCAPVAAHFGFDAAYRLYAWPSLALLIVAAWAINKWITGPLWRIISNIHSGQPEKTANL